MSNIKFTDSVATQDHNPQATFTQQDFVGQVFGGKYKILGEINKGGMGCVFKAEQLSLRRNVALKVVLASDDPQANQRFLLEASLTASLDHPNIVKIFDFGRTDDGVLFLVMELLTGQDLKSWVKANGPLSVQETIQMGKQLSGALSEAHRHNVIHRDIKPTNIMITKKPGLGIITKLIDFGLVKNVDQTSGFSKSGMMLGTPMYMSPEQITAQGVDDRSDIYAIGLTMYYALTGQIPYPKRGIDSLIHAQLSEELPALQKSNPLISETHMINWILRSAVAKRVEDRFQNTLQLLEALEICERNLVHLVFPKMELVQGALRSVNGDVELDAEIPSHPLVQSNSYVGDGSSISDEFANTLSLEVERSVGSVPGFESMSRLGPHSLLKQPSSAESEQAGSEEHNEKSKSSTSMVAVLVAVLLLFGGYIVLSSQEAPVSSSVEAVPTTAVVHKVMLDSVPSGADLFINGTIGGSTPATLKVEDDSLDIQLVLDGYETREFTITKDTQEEMVIRLRKMETDNAVEQEPPVRQVAPKPSTTTKAPLKPQMSTSSKVVPKKEKSPKKVQSKKKGELKETEWD